MIEWRPENLLEFYLKICQDHSGTIIDMAVDRNLLNYPLESLPVAWTILDITSQKTHQITQKTLRRNTRLYPELQQDQNRAVPEMGDVYCRYQTFKRKRNRKVFWIIEFRFRDFAGSRIGLYQKASLISGSSEPNPTVPNERRALLSMIDRDHPNLALMLRDCSNEILGSIYGCLRFEYDYAMQGFAHAERELLNGTPLENIVYFLEDWIVQRHSTLHDCFYCKRLLLRPKICSRCGIAEYCSTECQTADWFSKEKNMGHKRYCIRDHQSTVLKVTTRHKIDGNEV